MNTVETAVAVVQQYPGFVHRKTNKSVIVDAPSASGFSVCLYAGNNEFVVHFDGWHKHFDSEDEALRCFQLGLAGRCRLKVYRRWKFEYRWTLEYPTDDGWEEDSTIGLLFTPFWARREIIYRQNPDAQPTS
jgi:hypothetical protein